MVLRHSISILFTLLFCITLLDAEPSKQQPNDMQDAIFAMLQDKKVQDLFAQNMQLVGNRFSEDGVDGEEQQKELLRRLKIQSFYEEYLALYYPKAFVMRERFFANMTPDQIAKSLLDVVSVLYQKPWFYFVNKPNGFNVALWWEIVVDQCSIISDFLIKARVHEQTQTVFLPYNSQMSSGYGMQFNDWYGVQGKSKQKGPILLNYLKKKNYVEVFDFYALSFDYLIKLFNEGILLKDTKQANKYLRDLEKVVKRLGNSFYESTYQEHIKTCKELMARLRKRVGTEALDNPHDSASKASPSVNH